MNVALDVLTVVALLAVVAIAVLLGIRVVRDELDRKARGELEPELVRVHYREEGEPSVEGILVSVSSGHYSLRNARQIISADSSIALDGEAWIPRERVILIQRRL